MSRLRFGIVAGILFGMLDVFPMLGMELPNRTIPVTRALIKRFDIGFLILNVSLPRAGWIRGFAVGFLLNLPDAMITGSHVPILGLGVLGGMIIGYLWDPSILISKKIRPNKFNKNTYQWMEAFGR